MSFLVVYLFVSIIGLLFDYSVSAPVSSKEEEREIRVVNGIKLWPDGIVPYRFDKSVGMNLKVILWQAFEDIEDKTCVRFVPKRRVRTKDYVTFANAGQCGSSTGLVEYGEQYVYLGKGCHYQGHVFHELFHLLGFSHEHSRPDRDEYLTINSDNIMEGHQREFIKHLHNESIVLNPFDYNSIMMYGENTFSKGGGLLPTMTAKDATVKLLNPLYKESPSESDYWRLNKLYGCEDKLE